jgi:hypothetical protein
MLKPPEPAREPQDERPIGELVQQVVEDAKAYARAELEVAKAIANAKLKALGLSAGLLFVAAMVAQAAITVLAVGLFIILSLVMHPILAGLIASLVFAGLAGGLGWYAVQRLKRDL